MEMRLAWAALRRRRIGDIIQRGVRCVRPETPAAAVAQVMVEDGCDAVPVVTSAGGRLGDLDRPGRRRGGRLRRSRSRRMARCRAWLSRPAG
jgi:predicted transcriptional regulator